MGTSPLAAMGEAKRRVGPRTLESDPPEPPLGASACKGDVRFGRHALKLLGDAEGSEPDEITDRKYLTKGPKRH